jgi:hypothetical protein
MRCLAPFAIAVVAALASGCGPTASHSCTGADCSSGTCSPGDSRACYTGDPSTEGVGPCHGGMQTCAAGGTWGDCQGQVVPAAEVCNDGVDNNCNGMTDENIDADGDGWTTCAGDCCDDPSVCGNPAGVNPGAYDVPGDGVDNDCDGTIDNPPAACDMALTSTSTNAMDFAKAIDLCQTATTSDRKWGVIDAKFTLADGSGTPSARSHAVLKHYGTGVTPHAGTNLMLISSGIAAGMGDPNFVASLDTNMNTQSGFPADFLSANSGKLPNAPGCPAPIATGANDPIMLTLTIRVPTNSQSFSLDTNFFSDEFPEWTCSPYNDFFVVLLDSMYSGMNPNPTDKNLAFYTDPAMKKYPVGVNLAAGNTGLFTQCVNGKLGCDWPLSTGGSITTCTSTTELAGTGMDLAAPGQCDAGSKMGGATGWLTTTGNVKPGEIMTLRIAVWDTSDHQLDSLAVVDNFKWSATPSTPGTVIFRSAGQVGWGASTGEAGHAPAAQAEP